MAITQTGAIYKSLSFDNTSSRNYGVYITGEAVYNAPERAVEMISIPGRNGSFALDQGRFENITVKYPAGIFAETEADFAQAISDFRNFLCSKQGYCRLTDEYNPNEFRMAIYKSGLEVEPAQLRAGEFDIVFECKPQRFLTSGETAVAVANGGTLTNPTLFPSKPLLEVEGYGEIDINGDVMSVDNVPMGVIQVASGKTANANTTSIQIDTANLMSGDSFTLSFNESTSRVSLTHRPTNKYNYTLGYSQISALTSCSASYSWSGSKEVILDIKPSDTTFNKGTPSSKTATAAYTIQTVKVSDSSKVTTSVTATITISYDGNSTIQVSVSLSPSTVSHVTITFYIRTASISANSTKSALGHPMYIDLDIGEAYNADSGSAVSVNDSVSLPAKLSILAPGANTITYDNTFTSFKVVPRWWKV